MELDKLYYRESQRNTKFINKMFDSGTAKGRIVTLFSVTEPYKEKVSYYWSFNADSGTDEDLEFAGPNLKAALVAFHNVCEQF